MIVFVIQIIVIAMFASFVLTLANKWGIIEYVQINGNDFFSQMFNCYFCLSWWTCVVIAITWFLNTGDYFVLLTPFCSTNLTRKLL